MAVRRESVRIDVDSNLARVAIRDAAAVKLLAGTLDSVSKAGVQSERSNKRISDSLARVDGTTRRADTSINQLTGRLRVAADVAAILGPALLPVAAVGVPAITTLASVLGVATLAGGAAIVAFNGVGDALDALNKARDSGTAEDLLAAQAALEQLSPAAAQFTRQLSDMRGEWRGLRDAAASGLFPELTAALDDADVVFERGERVLGAIGSATGEMLADGLDSLGTDRWSDFVGFLEAEAKPTMRDLGQITGSFAHGLAELWMATQPLNRDGLSWLADGAADFDAWAEGLDQTQGYADFLDYIRENGPRAAEAGKAVAAAGVDLVTAIAPLGGPSLTILEAVADVFSAIADSPLGTPLFTAAAGFAALNRAMAVGSRIAAFDLKTTALGRTMTGTRAAASSLAGDLGMVAVNAERSSAKVAQARSRLTGYAGTAGKASLALGGLALATTDLGVGLLDTSTATGAMLGSIKGLRGGLAGAAIGAVLDLRAANADLEQSFNDASAAAASGDVPAEIASWSKAVDTLRQDADMSGNFWDRIFGGGSFDPGEELRLIFSGDAFVEAKTALSDLFGYGVTEAREDLAEFNREWQDAANTGDISDLLSAPFERASESIDGATNSTLDFIDAQGRLESLVAKGSALVAYEAAMDDLNATLRENGNTFDANTEAGRANITALNNSAQAAFDYAAQLKGADRIEFLRNTRDRLRQVAQDFPAAGRLVQQFNRRLLEATGRPYKLRIDSSGLKLADGQARQLKRQYDGLPQSIRTYFETYGVPATKGEMRAIAKAAGLTPRQITTVMTLQNAAARLGLRDINKLLDTTDGRTATPGVNANTRGASNALGLIISLLNSVDGRRTSSTHTHTNLTINEVVYRSRQAAGGGIPKNAATGGHILGPGTETSDSIPTMLSNNEFVMRAAAVRKYGVEQMHAMNTLSLTREDAASRISPALTPPVRRPGEVLTAINEQHRGRVALPDQASFDRQALERQGVRAAMRSGGGGANRVSVNFNGPLKVSGTLDTPWGPADIEGIAYDVAEERIEAHREADWDYERSMSGRVAK